MFRFWSFLSEGTPCPKAYISTHQKLHLKAAVILPRKVQQAPSARQLAFPQVPLRDLLQALSKVPQQGPPKAPLQVLPKVQLKALQKVLLTALLQVPPKERQRVLQTWDLPQFFRDPFLPFQQGQ